MKIKTHSIVTYQCKILLKWNKKNLLKQIKISSLVLILLMESNVMANGFITKLNKTMDIAKIVLKWRNWKHKLKRKIITITSYLIVMVVVNKKICNDKILAIVELDIAKSVLISWQLNNNLQLCNLRIWNQLWIALL